MSNHQEYMDSRMLHAFMDGELGGAQEEALFHKLSGDAALRAEMQDHLAIRKAIQHDIEAFTPPASATAAIFTTLGFTIPSTANAATPVGTTPVWRSLLFSGGAAVLAVATAFLVSLQFLTDLDFGQPSGDRVVSQPGTILIVEEPASVPDLPTPMTPMIPAAADVPSPTAANDGGAVRDLRERPVSPHDMELLAAATRETGDPRRIEAGQVQFFDLIPRPDGVTLYARNVALRSDPAPTVVSQGEPWFRNVNLGLLYALDDHHAIGIEGGREAFSQHFSGKTDLGLNVRIEQNPLAYWATAVYQFTGDPLLPHVHPFFQLQAGGAFDLGGLGRAALGLKFRPYDRIAVMVGAEGSVLLYRFQRNWFTTNKLGLTYGLTYEF